MINKSPLLHLQRLFKGAIALVLGTMNVIGIIIAIQLSQNPLILSLLTFLQTAALQAWVKLPIFQFSRFTGLGWFLHPINLKWMSFSISTFVPWTAHLVEWLHPITFGIAIALSVLVTSLSVGLGTWLITLDLPGYFSHLVNQWRVDRLKRRVEALRSQFEVINPWTLSRQDEEWLRLMKAFLTTPYSPLPH